VPDLWLYVFPQYTPGALTASIEEEKAARAAEEFLAPLIERRGSSPAVESSQRLTYLSLSLVA